MRPALLVLAVALAAVAPCAQAQQPETGERVALVVGNSSYRAAPLPNPRNDAHSMAQLLRRAGFSVDQRIDTSQQELKDAIERFGRLIRDPKVKFGLFYYAGHGLQLEWRNYLVPVSADIRKAEDVGSQTVDVSHLLASMEQAKGRSFLVILDACRDDPFAGTYRPSAKGLSQFDAPVGSLLAYATAPGNVALDGEGANGLYTSSLLQEFAVPGLKLEDAFKRVRLAVRLASRGQQVPWESTSLEEDVYLFPTQRRKLSELEQEQQLDQEIAAWARVKSSNSIDQLAAFLREHPSGYVSELAQSRLSRLMTAEVQRVALVEEEQQRLRQQQREREQAAAPAPPPAPAPAQAPSPILAQAKPVELAPTPYSAGYAEHARQYRIGDVHAFRVVDTLTRHERPLELKVTAVDVDGDRVEYNGGEYVSDLMGNVTTNTRGIFSSPRQFYPAEFYVGKKWQTMFRQQRPNGVSYTYRYDVRVVARERITVPAGTFDTYKIEARGFNVQLGASLTRNIWVAPGVPADIAHETLVRLRSNQIEQYDRQELVSLRPATQR